MGTRADFYVGRGREAEWLGSIAWDGYPNGVFGRPDNAEFLPTTFADEATWREAVATFFATRDDVTLPEQGWPWPWDDSNTTDYAYAYDVGCVWASRFGRPWFRVVDGEPRDEDGEPIGESRTAEFPDMSERRNVTFGKRSGLVTFPQVEES